MAKFDVGETVICSCTVKDDGTLKDPATSMNIAILNAHGGVVVAETAMTKDSVGQYHYDFATANLARDPYTVKYIATDGARITIEKESFTLE